MHEILLLQPYNVSFKKYCDVLFDNACSYCITEFFQYRNIVLQYLSYYITDEVPIAML